MNRKYKIVRQNLHDTIMEQCGSYLLFADLAGVSENGIRHLVYGWSSQPRKKTVDALVEMTGKPAEWLFAGDYCIEKTIGGKLKYKVLYENLYNHIHQNGSFVSFCENVGINEAALHRIVTGMADPKKSTIDKILEATGLPYEYIMKEKE